MQCRKRLSRVLQSRNDVNLARRLDAFEIGLDHDSLAENS